MQKHFNRLSFILLTIGWLIIIENAQAQNQLTLSGSRFLYPLIEKWISEYKKTNPSANIVLLSRDSTKSSIKPNLRFSGNNLLPEELNPQSHYINVSKYAVVPIANTQSEFAKQLAPQGLNRQHIQQLFFDENEKNQSKQAQNNLPFTFYGRQQKVCVPTTFAYHYGFEPKQFIGEELNDSDSKLVKAVQNDEKGVSYAPFNLIYDLQKRQILDKIKVIPLDLNNDGKLERKENIFDNLDTAISFLEAETTQKVNVPIAYIYFIFNKDNPEPPLLSFVDWVLKEGQKYTQAMGFLRLDSENLKKELKKTEELLRQNK